jgi:hypothetical protein
MSNKVIRLEAHSFTRMRKRHRVHFGAGYNNLQPSPEVFDDDGWLLPAGFSVENELAELVETVQDLLESSQETQRELALAEKERDDAISSAMTAQSQRDSLTSERDFLVDAHRDVSAELSSAHLEVDTLRAALSEVSHTLRKSNANVRRLRDDLAAIRRDVGTVAASPWAKVVRKRLLAALEEWD